MPGITRRPYTDSYPNVPDADGDDLQRYFDYCDREADDASRVLELFLRGRGETHGMIARGVNVAAWGLDRCYGCPDNGFARCKSLPPYPLRCPDCLVELLRDGGAKRLYAGEGTNPEGSGTDTSHEDAETLSWEDEVDRRLGGES